VNTGNDTVAVRPITVGIVDGEQVSVSKGLNAGEVVVTEGADRLREGAPVLLPANTPQHPQTVIENAPQKHGGQGQHRNRRQQPQGH
jgi:membrane fusion protein, multidrug efflux system